MESPYYEMTHDFEEENRLFQSGYVKGYHDAVMRCPDIVRCKDCKKKGNSYLCRFDRDLEEYGSHRTDADDDWFCADGEKRTD